MTSRSSNGSRPRAASARELATAGRSIVEGALTLSAGDCVVIVADTAGASIGRAIAASASSLGAQATFLRLESLGDRPQKDLHPSIRSALRQAQASVLIAGFEPGEFEMRSEFVTEAMRRNLKHAHLVGVSERAVVMGFSVDPRKIEALATALRGRIRPSSVLRVRSDSGTDLVVKCSDQRRWIEHTGVIKPGMKENLPAGELVTCPADVEGVYVANGSLGDGNGVLHAALIDVPVILHLEQGTVQRFESEDVDLLEKLTAVVSKSAYLDRVGLIGFGINLGMTSPAGDISSDQKMPGFHLSLGMTFPPLTGATWSATNWIAFTSVDSEVEIDGVPIFRGRKYLLP